MKLSKVSLKFLVLTFLLLILLLRLGLSVSPVLAQSSWVYDPEVTALGKASERARQLLFWYFNRPTLDNSPAILGMWAVSRNIALVLLVIIVVAFGFQLILTKEKTKFEGFIPRLIGLLAFAFFSYVLVLGLIQIGDTIMKFFIETIVGKNLFNITFVAQNSQASYINFVGMRRTEPEYMESARAAFTLIKLTNFTYYAIFTMLVLRKIILWFLLVVSPFLSLLFAFPFIKNVGWIWIGVFFQWLFYGPLFSIFLAGLVKIWEAGIPWGFDFNKVDIVDTDPEKTGQVFPTVINILYGGPAQKLTPTNTCNYVDTFAEYVIALIMLWAVMLLPWLLLRIFRDYCCEVIKSLEAATINLYGKLGGVMPPSLPSMPSPAKMELPFRKTIDATISTLIRSTEQTSMAKMKTDEVLNTVGLKVSSLADISRLEMNSEERKMALQKLEYLQSPSKVSNTALRGQFSTSNQELASRAAKGDVVAERTLAAASRVSMTAMVSLMQKQKEAISERETLVARGIITKKGVVTPRGRIVEKEAAGVVSPRGMVVGRKIAGEVVPRVRVGEKEVAGEVVPRVRVGEKEVAGEVAGKGVVGGVLVSGKKIAQAVPAAAPAPIRTVSVEDYEQVKKMWINNYRNGEVPLSEKIHSREDWLTSEIARISDTIEMISSKDEQKRAAGFENVAAVMPFLFLGGFTEDQVKVYLEAKLAAAKSQVEMEQVKQEVEKVKEEELVEIVRGEKEEKKAAQLEESLEMGEEDKKEKKEGLGEEEEGRKKEGPEALEPEETGEKKDQELAEPSSGSTEENLESNLEDLSSKEDKQKI